MNTDIDLSELIGERVRGLQEYAPEPLEELAVRLKLPVGQLIKLDANENPYGPTRRTLATLNGHIDYHRYPDPISRRLCQAIAQYIGVGARSVLVGNGSDELIDLLLKLFRPGPNGGGIGELINCPPTFGMYQFYAVAHDMRVREIARDSAFGVNVDAIERLCQEEPRPRILFLASPNNPDGHLLPESALRRLLALPVLLVLDEAYIEFSHSSCVKWVAEHDNLVVLRTFSKWAGLAGLRVGYGVFPLELMPALWRLKSPYNVNCAAQAAALATLDDLPEAQANIGKIVTERQRLFEKLSAFPFLRVYESQANYLLCRVVGLPMERVQRVMEERGIILRYYGPGPLRNYVRISVGTLMQDEAVLLALRALEKEERT